MEKSLAPLKHSPSGPAVLFILRRAQVMPDSEVLQLFRKLRRSGSRLCWLPRELVSIRFLDILARFFWVGFWGYTKKGLCKGMMISAFCFRLSSTRCAAAPRGNRNSFSLWLNRPIYTLTATSGRSTQGGNGPRKPSSINHLCLCFSPFSSKKNTWLRRLNFVSPNPKQIAENRETGEWTPRRGVWVSVCFLIRHNGDWIMFIANKVRTSPHNFRQAKHWPSASGLSDAYRDLCRTFGTVSEGREEHVLLNPKLSGLKNNYGGLLRLWPSAWVLTSKIIVERQELRPRFFFFF